MIRLRAFILPTFAMVCSACATMGPDSVSKAKDANETSPKRVSQDASDFIVEMVDARMMDYQEGRLANQRSTVSEIRDYGALMMKDQAQLLQGLKVLAASSSVEIPATISASKQDGLKSLVESDAKDFDKNFIRSIRIDHERDVKEFTKAAALEDPEVRRFASANLPVIQSHLDGIERIDDRY